MTVLVIEKNGDLLSFIKDLLRNSGIEVLTSSNGQTGLNVLKKNKNVHYIISDPKLPDMDMIEFLLKAASVQGKDSVTLVSPQQFFEFLGSTLYGRGRI